jgi:hypothetical protein
MRKLLLVPAMLALAIGVQAGGKGTTKVTLTRLTGEEAGWVKANATAGGQTKLSTQIDPSVAEYFGTDVRVWFRVRSTEGDSDEQTVDAVVGPAGIARAKVTLTTPETEQDYVIVDLYFKLGKGNWIPTPAKFQVPLKTKKKK